MSELLAIQDLRAGYGRVEVLHGVSLSVGRGEAVTVLGANGAGKSTLLKAVVGLADVHRGSVLFDSGAGLVDVTRNPPESLVRRGVALVPEGRMLFGSMSVAENLEVGSYPLKSRPGAPDADQLFEEVLELFPVLRERMRQTASTLSGGEQQMLAIGRALMSAPDLLLLDEPSLGLAPKVIRGIFEVFHRLREKGLTVLLIEQDAKLALDFADRGYVMQTGRMVLTGSADDLLDNDDVRAIYLGSWKETERVQ